VSAFGRTRRQAGGPYGPAATGARCFVSILARWARSTTQRRPNPPTLPLISIWGATSATSWRVGELFRSNGQVPQARSHSPAVGEGRGRVDGDLRAEAAAAQRGGAGERAQLCGARLVKARAHGGTRGELDRGHAASTSPEGTPASESRRRAPASNPRAAAERRRESPVFPRCFPGSYFRNVVPALWTETGERSPRARSAETEPMSARRDRGLPKGKCSLPKGKCSLPKGKCSLPKGRCSLPKGRCSLPKGRCSLPKGRCSLPKGKCSLAKRNRGLAKGKCSLPKGMCSLAKGKCSLAKGMCSLAKGMCSLAKGMCSLPKGKCSLAKRNRGLGKGRCSLAKGMCSLPKGMCSLPKRNRGRTAGKCGWQNGGDVGPRGVRSGAGAGAGRLGRSPGNALRPARSRLATPRPAPRGRMRPGSEYDDLSEVHDVAPDHQGAVS
jgi:hypothetical protein